MNTSKAIEELKIPLSTSDKFSLAFIPSLLIIALLFGLYITCERSYNRPDYFSFSKTSDILAFILFLILMTVCIYHLTCFNSYSKLAPVYSNLNMEEKTEVVNSLTKTYSWKPFETDNQNYFNFYYTKYLFGMSFLVTILIDEKGFYVNVGHRDFKLPAIAFYKSFEKKIIQELNKITTA